MANRNSDVPYTDIFDVVKRRLPIIVLGGIVGAATACIYSLSAQVQYASEAVVLLIQKDSSVATGSSATDLSMQSEGEELLSTHVQILTSPKVIRAALLNEKTGPPLIKRPSIAEKIPADVDGPESRKSAVVYIIKNLSVSRGGGGASKNAQVIRIRLQHSDSRDCRDILEAIVASYQNYLQQSVVSAGNEAGELIRQASLELEEKVAQQHKAYREFLHEAPIIRNDDGRTVNPQQIQVAKLEVALSDVQLRKSEVKSRLAIAEKVIDSPTDDPLRRLSILDGADVQRLSLLVDLDAESFQRGQSERTKSTNLELEKMLALSMQADTDSFNVGINHPRYQATMKHIDGVQKFLDDRKQTGEREEVKGVDVERLVNLYRDLLQHDLAHAGYREEELIKLLKEARAGSKEMIAYELEESRLRRDLERSQSLYEAVVDRLREVTLATDFGGFITDLISSPVDGVKCWPKIPFLVALGSLLGLLAGSASALVIELLDKSFKNQEDIERELNTSVMAHIPLWTTADLQASEPGPLQPSVFAYHQPKSMQSEAIRSLRTAVFFATGGKSTPVLQTTSSVPGEGKSTLSANLAVSIAQTNKRVLLVECDLRRPSQSEIFGIPVSPNGMSAVLGGECSIHDATVRLEQLPNLSIAPAGTIPDNPAELLTLPSLRDTIETVRGEYDFVIVDSPPLEPVSDPLAIASAVDFILLIMTLSKSDRSLASMSKTKLDNHGATIIGTVVNKCSKTSTSTYEYRAADSDNQYYKF